MPCSRTQHGLTRVGLEPPTSVPGVRGINHQATALPLWVSKRCKPIYTCTGLFRALRIKMLFLPIIGAHNINRVPLPISNSSFRYINNMKTFECDYHLNDPTTFLHYQCAFANTRLGGTKMHFPCFTCKPTVLRSRETFLFLFDPLHLRPVR